MWQCPTEGTYIVIEHNGCSVICPSEDVAPHSLYTADCTCKPKVQFAENVMHIVHNRVSDTQAVDAALKHIGL